MDLDITFKGKTMCTPVYIKMDAHEQLLLSEGTCHQLGIIRYDPSVQTWRGGRRRKQPAQKPGSARIPTVRVRLVHTTRLSPRQIVVVQAQVLHPSKGKGRLFLEPKHQWESSTGLEVDSAYIEPDKRGHFSIVITNPTGHTQKIQRGTILGTATGVTLIESKETGQSSHLRCR